MHDLGENPSSHPHTHILPLINYPCSAVLIGQPLSRLIYFWFSHACRHSEFNLRAG
jgi:hypothetical protein